ncbi:MAG: hypothetical protein AAB483_04245 [Patescibacteria group bacterium]
MSETRECQNCKQNHIIHPDDVSFYEKIAVPPPTLCPQCRTIRRMMWWNEHNLYRKDGMFSTFPEASPIKIMDRDAWWGDGWDAMEYGRDHDVSKSFFEQYKELLLAVPWPSRDIQRLVNSDYSNQASDLKNCYLVFNTAGAENCLYGVAALQIRDSMDYYFCGKSELCYEVMNIENCFNNFFSIDTSNCRNVWLSRDCHDCGDCFGCANLRSKQYHIFNQPYTKEEYKEKIKAMNLGSYADLQRVKDEAHAFWKTQPYRHAHATQNTKSIGDYLYNSKNSRYCYQVFMGENLAYCQNMSRGIKDSMDYTSWGQNAELIYESISVGENARNLKFCFNCWPSSTDLEYCVNVMSSSNCFGCVGLRKKQYCILNKQYTPSEYAVQISNIKSQMSKAGEYGEFFPTTLSPLAYNESVAIDYFPKTKEQAIAQGYSWRDAIDPNHKIQIPNDNLPDHINDVPDTITKETIECGNCKKAYRILDRELEFYQRFTIPLPRMCHRCRFLERTKLLNPMQWWHRQCAKCNADIETTFAPDRQEIIYCESCYQQEVN